MEKSIVYINLPRTKSMRDVLRHFLGIECLLKFHARHQKVGELLIEKGIYISLESKEAALILPSGEITNFNDSAEFLPLELFWVLNEGEEGLFLNHEEIFKNKVIEQPTVLNKITPMKTATRKQEIVRLCVLLTALDYEVTLEDSYHTKMGNRLWEEIDSSFEEEEVRSMTYEKLYFFFTNKEYTPYAESDDLDNWLKANIQNLYEAQNPQIFKEYDSISLAVHINKHKCIYWTSQQYQLIRLGRRIKFLRVQKGLRQNELGIHTSMVSQIENGLFNPTTSTLNKIALALGTNLTLK